MLQLGCSLEHGAKIFYFCLGLEFSGILGGIFSLFRE